MKTVISLCKKKKKKKASKKREQAEKRLALSRDNIGKRKKTKERKRETAGADQWREALLELN